MKIYAQVQAGTVVNTVEASPNDVQDPAFIWIEITHLDPEPGIGWTYDGQVFTSPPPPPPPVAALQPQASEEVRGQFWKAFSGDGMADGLQYCVKNADNTYSWKTIL